jgi:hypothetical protein
VPSDRPRTRLYALTYAALGDKKQSNVALKKFIAKYSYGAFGVALIYAFRNQLDEAFEWLELAYARRESGLIVTNLEPMLNNLHGDPRFSAFLKKIHLPG